MYAIVASSAQRPISIGNQQKRRVLEKRRIQTLKTWHENVKNIAKSEIDFITSILQDENDKDSENRDWIRDDEENDDTVGNRQMVKKDA